MRHDFTSEGEFIKEIAPAAQNACRKYGYLSSVLIAQACHENGYGIPSYWDNEGIAKLLEYNNMVGQKAELLNSTWADKTVWPGKSFTKETPEEYGGKIVIIKDKFRIFDSIEQSFCDFILFLLYASNYGPGGIPKYGPEVVEIRDPATLIKTVAGRGYATGSTYPTAIMKIIQKHDLTKYDDLSGKHDDVLQIKKLPNMAIKDITAENRSQVPASRGSNPIKFIVVHYLGVPNADNPYLYGGGYGGHYNVQRNGEIYKAANPRTAVVWQCGGGLQGSGGHAFYQICTNYNSIGIECGVCYAGTEKDPDGDSPKWFFTEATQESLVWLVSKLMDEYGIGIDHVIRHYDVTGKTCPNPYVLNNGFMTSWTWKEFLDNVKQYRKDGTITIPARSGPQPVPVKNYLEKGDTGDAVREMQIKLIACGYNCGAAGADGDFGNATLNAVKEFQAAHDLAVDGLYGSASRAVLEAEYKAVMASKDAPKEAVYNGVDYTPVYRYTYYRRKYSDLRKAFGTKREKYFQHFCEFGMAEGRQATASFNVQRYRDRYTDLQQAFGNNLPEYYRHYCIYGKKEGRKAN